MNCGVGIFTSLLARKECIELDEGKGVQSSGGNVGGQETFRRLRESEVVQHRAGSEV